MVYHKHLLNLDEYLQFIFERESFEFLFEPKSYFGKLDFKNIITEIYPNLIKF